MPTLDRSRGPSSVADRTSRTLSVAENGRGQHAHTGAIPGDAGRHARKACHIRRASDKGSDTNDTESFWNLSKWVSARGVVAIGLLGVFLWSHWPTLRDLFDFWQLNPDYSAGQLVPLVAIYLVWSDRKALLALPTGVCWPGLALLLFAQAIRLYGLYDMYGSLERYSVILATVGMVLFIFGPSVVWRLKWVFAFLFLMVPLPGRLHNNLSVPLQTFATASAVYGLELMGYLVAREGNVLRVSDQTVVAVQEACSGLRMLTAFVVVAAVLGFVVRRPSWQKAVVVVSSIPVAILANTLRLIVTVLLFEYAGSKTAERFFHDFAGLTMMPLAVAVVVLELQVLRFGARLFGDEAHREIGRGSPKGGATRHA